MLDRFLVNLKKQKSCNIQNICISKQMVSKRFKSSNIQNTGISEKKKDFQVIKKFSNIQ